MVSCPISKVFSGCKIYIELHDISNICNCINILFTLAFFLEYVALSRDTTESDLKQRREIINGTAHYIDQSAVRAASKGRVLVLEGIEKAERNVLPVLVSRRFRFC